jgi:hypothetical protein
MRLALAGFALFVFGCGFEERPDFLIGRTCAAKGDCDPEQECLPHRWDTSGPSDLRCRDSASFEPIESREPPLAYCDSSMMFECPEGLVCNADRVRPLDGGVRRKVCQRAESPFGPPP